MLSEKNIFIARHAETIFNKEQIVQGQSLDGDLSDEGYKQADIFYLTFKDFHFDKIYISGLKRTCNSVKRFIDSNVPYETMQELNEINWGEIEGAKLENETKNKYLSVIQKWKSGDYTAKIENGESIIDVRERLAIATNKIMSDDNAKDVLIVTHSRTLKILLCFLLNIEIKQMDTFKHKNMTLYNLEYRNGQFKLKANNDNTK